MECVSNTMADRHGGQLPIRRRGERSERTGRIFEARGQVSRPARAATRTNRITLVSYAGSVPGRGGRAAHDQARGGRSDRHDALARPRQGAGGRQGDPQDDARSSVPVSSRRAGSRSSATGAASSTSSPRSRRSKPTATCARSTRCSRTRSRCSKPSTRWRRSGSRTRRSTACSPALCARSPSAAARS